MQVTVVNLLAGGTAANSEVSLRIENVINPDTMSTSAEGIMMQTLTQEDYLIDQTDTSTQLKSKSTESESITVIGDKLYPQDATINKETKLFF